MYYIVRAIMSNGTAYADQIIRNAKSCRDAAAQCHYEPEGSKWDPVIYEVCNDQGDYGKFRADDLPARKCQHLVLTGTTVVTEEEWKDMHKE